MRPRDRFFFIYLGKLEERRRYPFEALARISRLDNRNTNDALLLLFKRNKTGESSA